MFRGSDWYLLAWCRMRGDFRFFKLFRMDALALTGEHFVRRAPQAAPQAANNEFVALQTALTVRAAPQVAYRVRDEFAPEQWEQQEDGSFIIRFVMLENQWMYEYLMTYGAGMKVLEPERVRTALTCRLRAALEQYVKEN